MVKISVIIPIYNVEKYIEESLDSLLNQTLIDDIEVLMIDDGSTDNSRYIIEKYALDYSNFHAYHKKNEGQSIARNYGFKLAKGDYIHFFDSDDVLPNDFYENVYNEAVNSNVDVVVSNVFRFGRYNIGDGNLFNIAFSEFSDDAENISLDEYPSLLWDTAIWNKIYKYNFIKDNNIQFLNEKILYEDLIFSLEVYCNANSISFLKNTYYYWRIRGNNTSITQNSDNIKSFEDRLKILKLRKELLINYNSNLLNVEFSKWLHHDLKVHLRNFRNFPDDYYNELLYKLNNFIDEIPDSVFDSLHSFEKILYEMIKNYDIDSLLNFAHLEKEFTKIKDYPFNIPKKYLLLSDFNKDYTDEKLIAKVLNIEDNDAGDLLIDFDEYVKYDFNEHIVEAKLVNDDEFPLEINDNHQIVISNNLIKGRNHLKIKIIHITDNLIKESYLKSNKRFNFSNDDFDIDVGIGIKKELYIDSRIKNNNEIIIDDVSFDNNEFIFTGTSKQKINNVFLMNVVNFNEMEYSVQYSSDKLMFIIPYEDICNFIIKKWELNSNDALNNISLVKKFEFYKDYSHIVISNVRDKILFTSDVSIPVDELSLKIQKTDNRYSNLKDKYSDIKLKNKNLKSENKKLNKKISKLENKINDLEERNIILHDIVDEYKSRKVIKIADKIKGFKN